ncbi:MAG TPA: lysophospholipid acyltransferase family protein [Anaerolineales bacterium]|nr:lysophospholipid acyltransferase family protein [Anaerolineales bacterium]
MIRVLRFLIRILLNLIARFELRGKENVPLTGGMILAANHNGILDIFMVYYGIDRTDLFIPLAEKFGKIGWIRWFARHLNFLFVDRFNPDLKAIRKMIALMEEGRCLVIAPEGTRSQTGALNEGKPGVAYLAARSGFPVIPIAITGTADKAVIENLKRFRKSHITLTGGKPFIIPPLPNKDRDVALQKYTDEIMCQIAALLPEQYRGVYAEHPRLKELLSLPTQGGIPAAEDGGLSN